MTTPTTLKEQAKALPARKMQERVFSDEEIELALAYMEGDVALTQLAGVLGTTKSNARAWLASRLRAAFLRNIIARVTPTP